MDASGWDCRPVKVVDEEQLAHAQRVGGAVGGACAMAMIFDAPVGGVLYMFEEITVTAWPMELTFRAFVGTMICTMLSYFLLNLCGTSLKAFVLYDRDPAEPSTWQWRDVPFVEDFYLSTWALIKPLIWPTRRSQASRNLGCVCS